MRAWIRTGAGLVVTAVLLFPLYWMLNASVLPSDELISRTPTWFPVHGSLAGYRNALSTQGGHLLVSLLVASGTVVLTLLIALPAAYGMAQLHAPGRRVLMFALLVAQMIPGIVMADAFYQMADKLGLIDNPLGLILADSTLCVPFATLTLQAFLREIPAELSEAAWVDGASPLRVLRSVILPVGIYRFIGAHLSDWNSVMATGVIASLPAALLLVLAQRYVAAGITSGAVKD
jgi:multiple sugar transport system permease protein